jgi:hypothetical protein
MTSRQSVLATTRLQLDDIDAETEQGGATPVPGVIDLALDVESQEQDQWCWAAVAVSVAKRFNSSTPWLQCTLANVELHQTSCCDEGNSPSCDVPWYLERALERIGHLLTMKAGAVNFSEVRVEIAADRPLCARIGWPGGDGHFVTIVGIRQTGGGRFLRIGDPARGNVEEAWTNPASPYLGFGSWTHAYFTWP